MWFNYAVNSCTRFLTILNWAMCSHNNWSIDFSLNIIYDLFSHNTLFFFYLTEKGKKGRNSCWAKKKTKWNLIMLYIFPIDDSNEKNSAERSYKKWFCWQSPIKEKGCNKIYFLYSPVYLWLAFLDWNTNKSQCWDYILTTSETKDIDFPKETQKWIKNGFHRPRLFENWWKYKYETFK